LRSHLSIERLEDRSMLSVVVPQVASSVTVMSQNLSLGADVTPVIDAILTGNQKTITSAVTTVWQNVQASNFPLRAASIAAEIVSANPGVVGLQEAELFHVAGAVPAQGDYLQILLNDVNGLLQQQHATYTYKVTAVTKESDLTFSGYTSPGVLQSIELTDRDAILTRSDVVVSNVQQQQHFAHDVVLPEGFTGKTVTIFRGWESVDVQQGGQQFRVINTHLEEGDNLVDGAIQATQALELLKGPASTTSRPTILLGDFNADADVGALTYRILVGAGFGDAWTQTHPGNPGYTWPLPSTPGDNQRIDLVLFRGGFSATSMSIVGTSLIPSTSLYPSDHAGVVATLTLSASHAALATSAATNSPLKAIYPLADQAIGALYGEVSASLTIQQRPKGILDTIDRIFAGIG
jgi:endonuclease/exonuclease/phosphatase family metal-dependent hydrolase